MVLLAAALAWAGGAAPARAAAPFGPFRTAAAPVTLDARAEERPREHVPGADFLRFAFLAYQRAISAQDGPRCAHWPTCSAYGVQAVRRHGLLGFFFAVDRIWRKLDSSPWAELPWVTVGGVRRAWDPLDASDYWLRGVEDHEARENLPPETRQ